MTVHQPRALAVVEHVSKIVSTRRGDVIVLNDISFAVPEGGRVCLSGPRGSGKTSLLRLLAGLDRPSSGMVSVDGRIITHLSEDEAARWRGRSIGMVLRQPYLLETLTVRENVLLALEIGGTVPRGTWREHTRDCLDAVGVVGIESLYPADLSPEQMQRVTIARAIVNNPILVLADEPTGQLSPRANVETLQLLEDLCSRTVALVYATSNPALADAATERVCLLDGRVTERTYGAVPGIYG